VLVEKFTAKVAEAVCDEASDAVTEPAPSEAEVGTVTLQGVPLGSVPDEVVLAGLQFDGVSVVCVPAASVNLKVSADVAAKWLPVTVTRVPPAPPAGDREIAGDGVAPTPPPRLNVAPTTAVPTTRHAAATRRTLLVLATDSSLIAAMSSGQAECSGRCSSFS
jgi:hypothetical protein